MLKPEFTLALALVLEIAVDFFRNWIISTPSGVPSADMI